MSDDFGSRGSRGNLIKLFVKIYGKLEKIVDLLTQIEKNTRNTQRDNVVEKLVVHPRDKRYNNQTGQKRG